MLINVTRFNKVQERIYELVLQLKDEISTGVEEVIGARKVRSWSRHKSVFDKELPDCNQDWLDVRKQLKIVLRTTTPLIINMTKRES